MEKEYNYLTNKAKVLYLRRRRQSLCRVRGICPYNPVLMRFTGVDPLASKYPAISPFAYCLPPVLSILRWVEDRLKNLFNFEI